MKALARSSADGSPTREYALVQLYVYLTAGCNLACRHCWIASTYQDPAKEASAPFLDLTLLESTLQQARPLGLSMIKLTGGEPLLHPEIENILERVRCLDLGLAVETNGVLCTSALARKIADCKSARVSVSLDGVDAATHEWLRGVRGCFEATLAGIRNLVGAGIKPELVMALHRRNRDQMEAFLRLAESLGARAVKFNIVQPIARGQKLHDEAETLSIPELVGVGRWVETRLSKTTRLPVLFDHPMAFRPLSRLFGENGTGCQRCHILGILGLLTNGGYALCGIGYAVPELVFGHSERDRLEDVWDRAAVLVELRQGLPKRLEGVCATCLMKRICLGCCIANNYYQGRSLWSPFWYCEQAMQTGLFPESRICPTKNS